MRVIGRIGEKIGALGVLVLTKWETVWDNTP